MINKEKVSMAAQKIVMSLGLMRFTGEETVALIKCLDHLTKANCLENDLVVVSKKKLMKVISGENSINSIEGI